jgi:fermentation-respiration switch protein FrsA (DUF1100 family)
LREWEGTPEDAGLKYENITLKAKDGVNLNAWYIPHPRSTHTLLYFHGNAGNISHRIFALPFFHRMGMSVFFLEYRGYGKSEGRPSEKAFYADARSAYEYLRDSLRMPQDKIVLFGESLGGAVALDLATEVPVGAIICDGTFSSTLDMGKIYFPYTPLRWIISQKYDSVPKVRNISAPKFFVHSRQDQIVPFALGEKLYAQACHPKEFIARTGDHSNYLEDPAVYEGLFKKILSSSK